MRTRALRDSLSSINGPARAEFIEFLPLRPQEVDHLLVERLHTGDGVFARPPWSPVFRQGLDYRLHDE